MFALVKVIINIFDNTTRFILIIVKIIFTVTMWESHNALSQAVRHTCHAARAGNADGNTDAARTGNADGNAVAARAGNSDGNADAA